MVIFGFLLSLRSWSMHRLALGASEPCCRREAGGMCTGRLSPCSRGGKNQPLDLGKLTSSCCLVRLL